MHNQRANQTFERILEDKWVWMKFNEEVDQRQTGRQDLAIEVSVGRIFACRSDFFCHTLSVGND